MHLPSEIFIILFTKYSKIIIIYLPSERIISNFILLFIYQVR